MANPTLSKTGVPTVTLSRAPVFPLVDTQIPLQFTGFSDSGIPFVATIGRPRRIITLNFEQLTELDRTNILAFLENNLVNFGQNSFTYTDHDGQATEVRFLDEQVSLPVVSADNVTWQVTFTVVT